jgi:hypothetical protein
MRKALLLILILVGMQYGQIPSATLYHAEGIMPQLELVIESGDNQSCAVNTSPAEDLVMRIQYASTPSEPPVKNGKVITYPSVPINIEVTDPDGTVIITNYIVNTDENGLGKYTLPVCLNPGKYKVTATLDIFTYPEFSESYLLEYIINCVGLEIKVDDATINESNLFAYLNIEPNMPNFTARLIPEGLQGEVEFVLRIEYLEHGRTDITEINYFISANDIWNVSQSLDDIIVGGTVIISYRYFDFEERSFTFYIRGQNPSELDIKDYVGLDPWFIYRLIRQESSYKQFYSGIPSNPNEDAGKPYWGSPNGFGLFMLDNPIIPTKTQLWNWKENCDGGGLLLNQKHIEIEAYWERQAKIVDDWNELYPENMVLEASITYNDITFNYPVGSDEKSFEDAIWIKFYNGTGEEGLHFTGVLIPSDDNNPDTIEIPYWSTHEYATVDGSIIYYVRDVCNWNDLTTKIGE